LPTIWTASASYHFTPTIMGYVSAGTSSRQGTESVGPLLTAYGAGVFPQAAILQYANLKAEYSHSYEVGLKTQFDGHHGVLNLTYFHQDFSNFQYANAGNITITNGLIIPPAVTPTPPSVDVSGAGANVPVKVDGVEGELSYRFSPNFSADIAGSYVHSRITGGTVACNNLSAPTIVDSLGNSIHVCPGTGPASFSPRFTATVRSEYDHDIGDGMTGYLRGQLSIYGATQYNSDVPYNKQNSYALLNAYLGVRASGGNWDMSFFVKNLTNTKTVLASAGGNTQALSTIFASAGQPYTTISYTPPRQIGVNLRVAFGSR
jgi:iron complex outermembrane receptor protein